MSGAFVEPAMGNGGRRTGIRAGAVSGPWRGVAGSHPERTVRAKVLTPFAVETDLDTSGDLPAPVFRVVGAETPETPEILESPAAPLEPPRLVAEPELDWDVPIREAAYSRRRSPVLGAVLAGSAIAVAIVALAFAFRPQTLIHPDLSSSPAIASAAGDSPP